MSNEVKLIKLNSERDGSFSGMISQNEHGKICDFADRKNLCI